MKLKIIVQKYVKDLSFVVIHYLGLASSSSVVEIFSSDSKVGGGGNFLPFLFAFILLELLVKRAVSDRPFFFFLGSTLNDFEFLRFFCGLNSILST